MGEVNNDQDVPVSPVLPRVPAAGTGEHSGQQGHAMPGEPDGTSDGELADEPDDQFENEPEDGREW